MKTLICTSYNKTDKGLVLRNNWTESFSDNSLKNWGIVYSSYLDRGSISKVYEGTMDLENVVVNVRIITV